LHLTILDQFNCSCRGPVTSQLQFVELIKKLQETPSPSLNPPLFLFYLSEEAAAYNAKILADHYFNLDQVIRKQHPSQISYGSEFRSVDQLRDLLHLHPLWPRLREILENGATFPLAEIPDAERLIDLNFHFKRGNHKSATDHHQVLLDLIKEDVERGFALPLPMSILHCIPNASLAPLGCIKQATVDALGNKAFKHRMTHDQSFPGPYNLSVNLRVLQEKLPPIMYSFTLLRSIHYILDIRKRHPCTKIYICKFDIDAAYRRCNLSSLTAFESLTIFAGFLLVALRMTLAVPLARPCGA
jgi:hypothetical protein